MSSRIKSQQENRIPLGKKRKALEKTGVSKTNEELEVDIKETIPRKKSSHINKKSNKRDEFNPLKIINVNVAPTDTSLTRPTKIPRSKLSTVKEIEENTIKKISTKTKTNNAKILKYNPPTENDENKDHLDELTVQVNSQENIEVEDINNTINEMKIQPVLPEAKLSPFVCTTRGHKWKPSPRKPPKLSELYDKYDDNNIADTYRKKLDVKTIELQNKIKYWVELSSENGSNIPQSIKDEIDVVCGQTKLLTTDKFMQMRSLVEEYDNKSGSMPITTGDLDGFWDMMLLQVEKLEGQFSQLVILRENNWAPLQPIAKRVINKVSKIKKRPEVKSRIAGFLKSQKLNEKKVTKDCQISDMSYSNHSKFNEMTNSNHSLIISSTPTSNGKTVTFTPVLLKTLELSRVARRSGMTPIILTQPHVSLLKPALKNTNQEKGTKLKSIKFDQSTIGTGFITPENSYNGNHKSTQDRVATPHIKKAIKENQNIIDIESKINPSSSANTKKTLQKNKSIKAKTNMTVAVEKSTNTQLNECSIRRSSRLANKPSKNYKV